MYCIIAAESSEEIPLNPSEYPERQIFGANPRSENRLNSARGYNDVSHDVEENLFGATSPPIENILSNAQFQTRAIYRNLDNNSFGKDYKVDRDMAAMSVASIYDDENKEMEADK